jgi:hypothetical protein
VSHLPATSRAGLRVTDPTARLRGPTPLPRLAVRKQLDIFCITLAAAYLIDLVQSATYLRMLLLPEIPLARAFPMSLAPMSARTCGMVRSATSATVKVFGCRPVMAPELRFGFCLTVFQYQFMNSLSFKRLF